jgi:hypothetical protein
MGAFSLQDGLQQRDQGRQVVVNGVPHYGEIDTKIDVD